MDFRRISNLPPYVFTIINNLKIEARRAGVDVIDLGFGVLTVLSPGRRVEAFRVDPKTFESVAVPVDRNLADEAIAHYQTASRAFRQGALQDVVSALQTR